MIDSDRTSSERLDRAYAIACEALLAERCPAGYWLGELSSSALATATAVSALSLVAQSEISNLESQISDSKSQIRELIARGIGWLAQHQNPDGGWGDTTLSSSNISTSMLVRAAFHLAGAAEQHASLLERATAYIDRAGGSAAVVARYGADRTFAVPILANCALAGQADWSEIAPLPFELACLPHGLFRFLRLHVVSYALPALIAIGQLIHAKRPTRSALIRWIRERAVGRSLRKLEAIQPPSGGFLEAIPLTAFVTMSLAATGQAEHPVARRGVEFLVNSVRPDGSWPIDSNLSVWLTTLSINALANSSPDGYAHQWFQSVDAVRVRDWLVAQQLREVHPYTKAASGGWGWSHLSGSVPDVDDTSGALLALSTLARHTFRRTAEPWNRIVKGPGVTMPPALFAADRAAERGFAWLIGGLSLVGTPFSDDLVAEGPTLAFVTSAPGTQNRDGGWPTFCRGWGKLPFDRSGSDLTAHAIRALWAWRHPETGYFDRPLVNSTYWFMPRDMSGGYLASGPARPRVEAAIARGIEFLRRQQQPDGSWLPLWFGNEHMPDNANPTYGTAKVLAVFRDVRLLQSQQAHRAVQWLLAAQQRWGGWGGGPETPSSVEETGLAIEALTFDGASPEVVEAVRRGTAWLVDRVESGEWKKPSPIGLYFAKLWYFEKLYPLIFTVAALGRARRVLRPQSAPTAARA